MMQRAAQDLWAEFSPIMAGVCEMKMPGLIDFVRRRDRVPCGHRKKQEPAVLIQHPLRIGRRPAVLFCQARDESPVGSFRLDPHRFELAKQRLLLAG